MGPVRVPEASGLDVGRLAVSDSTNRGKSCPGFAAAEFDLITRSGARPRGHRRSETAQAAKLTITAPMRRDRRTGRFESGLLEAELCF